ncbi:MAG: hypothetical protein Q8N99_06080 [Nanoarchaeota archaeon]|nr:hypothetical protein [Nanoarchaeota archaeon]
MEKEVAKELLKRLAGKKSLELIKIFSKEKIISLEDIAKKLKVEVKELRGYIADITKELNKITNKKQNWYSIEKKWVISKEVAKAIKEEI